VRASNIGNQGSPSSLTGALSVPTTGGGYGGSYPNSDPGGPGGSGGGGTGQLLELLDLEQQDLQDKDIMVEQGGGVAGVDANAGGGGGGAGGSWSRCDGSLDLPPIGRNGGIGGVGVQLPATFQNPVISTKSNREVD
jgi:hypothetical protein